MLNEEKDSNGRTFTCTGEEDSMYSLVSEAENDSNPSNDDGAGDAKLDNNCAENAKSVKLGLLILDGEEKEDDDDDDDGEEAEEESKRINTSSALLSVPETVFLPSEIRSVTAVSCVTTTEQDKGKGKTKDDDNHVIGNGLWEKLRQLSSVSRWRNCISGLLVITSLILASLFASSWRSHYVWKSEVLRLREDLQMQKALLPVTLSLLKEREHLLRKLNQLEEDIERAKNGGSRGSKYDDIFPPGESDDDAILSIKNCYVDASLSLGRCSKEWQRWWSDTPATNSARGPEEDSNAEEIPDGYASYDDGFTDEMSKLVKSFKNGLIATTSQSYYFLEKTFKD